MEQIRRTRREGRVKPSFDEDRVRGTLQHTVLDKAVTKNPTRFVPDLPGFTCLTKNEIKKDTWDIDKRSSLMDMNETDSEDEEVEQTVMRTMGPPCAGESSVFKKKKRLAEWMANSASIDGELKEESSKLLAVKTELARLLRQEDDWIYTLEVGRGQVCSSLSTCKEKVGQLKSETNLLYTLLLSECGSASRKKRTMSVRDALQELQEKVSVMQQRVQEYEKLSAEHKAIGKSPVTFVECEELDYPEDAAWFQSKEEEESQTLNINDKAISNSDLQLSAASSDLGRNQGQSFNDDEAKNAEEDHMGPDDDTQEGGQRQKRKQEEEADALEGNVEAEGDEYRTDGMMDLIRMLHVVEEATRLSDGALGDLDIFFNEDDDAANSASLPAQIGPNGTAPPHVIECEKSKKLIPSMDQATQLSVQFESIRSECAWAGHLEDMVAPTGSGAVRKRRRGPSMVPVSAFAYQRTPRGVPILISPLSQFEDHYLGAIMGPQNAGNHKSGHTSRAHMVTLPSSMFVAEDAVLERCKLQSAAASAQSKIRKLRHISIEWKKQLIDGQLALSRTEKTYQQAAQDDYQEAKRIRKELLNLGIASAGTDELPMSPIAETSGWGFANGNGFGRGGRGVFGARVRTKLNPKGPNNTTAGDDNAGDDAGEDSAGEMSTSANFIGGGYSRPKGTIVGAQGRGRSRGKPGVTRRPGPPGI